MKQPALIALSGLPGVGKTTIARLVAERLDAVFLRIDTAEQALLRAGEIAGKLNISGYAVCFALAEDNLRLGRIVVADSVNPIALTRDAFRQAAERAGARFVPVELTCTDQTAHRHRVETRRADIAGHELPDWQAVCDRDYRPWAEAALTIDTGRSEAEAAAAAIVALVQAKPG